MNTKKQGDVGLGKAISFYTGLGWTVSLPLTDSQDYDLIVDTGEKLERVQVKTTKNREFPLRVMGGNRSWSGVVKKFDNSKVERLFLYRLNGECYDVSTKGLKNKNGIVPKEEYKV